MSIQSVMLCLKKNMLGPRLVSLLYFTKKIYFSVTFFINWFCIVFVLLSHLSRLAFRLRNIIILICGVVMGRSFANRIFDLALGKI